MKKIQPGIIKNNEAPESILRRFNKKVVYLDNIELVVVGGESDINARIFDYSWALDIREQCIRKDVSFEFRQCGTYTIKDGKQHKIQTKICVNKRN